MNNILCFENDIPFPAGYLVVVGLALASLCTPDVLIGVRLFSAKLSFKIADPLLGFSDLAHAHGVK
jgi:hypothetical protein